MNATSWSTALPDWEDRILAGKSLVPALPLFRDEANIALKVFKKLKLIDVVGQPTMGAAGGEWLFDFVEAVFGAYDPESAVRMLQEFFMLIAKKNSKSTSAAGIMVTALLRNRRENGEYLIVSPTKTIADNSYKPAAAMIRADRVLSARFHVQDNIRQITDRKTDATLQVKAADTDVVGGQKATGILVDELWLFGQMAKGENVMSEITGSLAARPDGFVIYLTTQSDVAPAGVFRKKLIHHREVRDGKRVDPRAFQVIYEHPARLLDEDQLWMEEQYFHVPNPNIDRSVSRSFLRAELATARENGQDSLVLFAAKHFNIEIGMALKSGHWVGALSWEKAVDTSLKGLDDILARSEVATVGVDGGGADDLLALVVIGRERGTRRWLAWAHAWAHPLALERRKSNRTEYDKLVEVGDLTVIEDYPEDLNGVVEIIKRVQTSNIFGCVGMDRIGLDQAVDAFDEIGLSEENKTLFGVPQGYVLTGAIKSLERKLIDGSFVHCGQQLLRWAIGNCKVEPTKNAFLITKQASGTAKIDPAMALFDAAYLMGRNPEAQGSIYGDEDDYAEAFGRKRDNSDDDDKWDPAILKDSRHPMFAEHVKRFETWQDRHPDRD